MQAKNYTTKEISRNLTRLIRLDGRRQKEIAESAGVNPVNLCRWAKGKSLPSLETVARLADTLGVSPEEITRQAPGESSNCNVINASEERELYEWRERALIAEAKLEHLQKACAALGEHVSALGTTVKNFSDIISG